MTEEQLLAEHRAELASGSFNDDALRDHAELLAQALTLPEIAALTAEIARLRHAITEASDPDFLWGAMDNVNDMDVGLEQFAAAASRAIRAALEIKL